MIVLARNLMLLRPFRKITETDALEHPDPANQGKRHGHRDTNEMLRQGPQSEARYALSGVYHFRSRRRYMPDTPPMLHSLSRRRRMEKFSEIVCWIAVGVLGLFMVVWVLTPGVGSLAAFILLFVQSPLPWWILAPAGIAIVAGFLYLLKRNVRRTRISPK
jgi:hypothetical protein